MRWHDLLFLHWSFEPDSVDRLLPAGVTLDTWGGRAYVGVVPFRMSDVSPRFIPALPGLSAFPELNVRTYVEVDGKPGVWFFSLDATNKIAVRVARRAFHLPYMDARMHCRPQQDGWIDYASQRTHKGEPPANLVARYRPRGVSFTTQPGSLEHWLTSRYCLYVLDRKQQVLRGEIDHLPWTLQDSEVEITENSMLAPLGLSPTGQAHVLFAKDLSVRAWTNR